MHTATPDSVLVAVRTFDDAVHSLIGPRTRLVVDDLGRRTVTTAPSLYTEMSQSIAAQTGTAFGGVARSMPPLWIDGLDWLMTVDSTTTGWWDCAEELTTAQALTLLLGYRWSPEEIPQLDDMTYTVQGFALSAESLLDGRRTFSVEAACPECSATEVARKQGWETVRKPALNVSITGAFCLACGMRWEAEHLMALAHTLGVSPLAGIDPRILGVESN